MRGRGLEPLLIFTGQHPIDSAHYGLDSFASVRLGCPGGGDPHRHCAAVAAAVLPMLCDTRLLLVQGDTSSALGSALAASTAQVAIGHVEAGLRSHDRRRPWPEEEFRIEIDRRARLLFAPTELSAANLRRERVTGSIHVTGNSGIDALRGLAAAGRAPADASLPRLLVTCHRRESWGLGLAGIAGALRSVAEQRTAAIDLVLHPNPATAAHVRSLLLGCEGVTLHLPFSHRQTIAAMLGADMVLSDSGGIQEECSALGVPLLVLRERTERPEAIASGAMALVGTSPKRIVDAVRDIAAAGARARSAGLLGGMAYGDGRAGERIAAIVSEWMNQTGGASLPEPGRRHAAS